MNILLLQLVQHEEWPGDAMIGRKIESVDEKDEKKNELFFFRFRELYFDHH